MPRILIIGYGNTLRGDDGIGYLAASHLQVECADQPQVTVLAVHQPTPELSDALSHCDRAIFIDASVAVPEGEVRVTEVTPGPDVASPSTHHLSPTALLDMAKLLYGSCPKAWLIAVGACDFACRDSLSPQGEAALARVLEQVRDLLNNDQSGS